MVVRMDLIKQLNLPMKVYNKLSLLEKRTLFLNFLKILIWILVSINIINFNKGLVVYGIEDTMKTILASGVETIICWEGLTHNRVSLTNK